MKTTLLSLAALFTLSAAHAQTTWNADKAHSRVGFTVTHLLLSEVDGNFNKFDAKITSAKPDLSDAVIELTADIASINTSNEYRDNDLKSPKYFDAAQFPALTFKSTSFQKVDGKKYKLMGNLTMHGVTKPVTLDAMLTGPVVMENPRGKQEKAGMKITGTIKRADFGVGTGTPVAVVSDEIEIRANGEFVKQEAAMAEKK
jgi:polyisoprenoid-binding protein YceI